MSKLPLAVEIADIVMRADGALDVEAIASELHEAFPEAAASREDIADTLVSEREAAGRSGKTRTTQTERATVRTARLRAN